MAPPKPKRRRVNGSKPTSQASGWDRFDFKVKVWSKSRRLHGNVETPEMASPGLSALLQSTLKDSHRGRKRAPDNLSDGDDQSDWGTEDDDDKPWFERIQSQVSLKTQSSNTSATASPIGLCFGCLIRREQISGTFYTDIAGLRGPTSENIDFAFDLFDRYGRLRQEWKEHPVRKGLGLWQEELDQGNILLIENLFIDQDHRRHGLGRKLVLDLIEKIETPTTEPFFVLVSPGWLRRASSEERYQHKTEEELCAVRQSDISIATSFYRSLGFRRIGSSCWLGLSSAPDHPARAIPATADLDLPDVTNPSPSHVLSPIQAALASCDTTVLETLKRLVQQFQVSDPGWLSSDEDGSNLLHLIAKRSFAESIRWALDQDFGDQLLNARNAEGDTPLDALCFELERERTQRKVGLSISHVSDNFKGFSTASVQCLAYLRGISAPSEIDQARLRFGCSCGQCIQGFLSPQMKFALTCTTEIKQDLLIADLELGAKDWSQESDLYTTHLANRVRRNLAKNKSMRKGFRDIFGYVGACLRARKLPTTANVQEQIEKAGEQSANTKEYFQHGGSTAAVVMNVFETAKDEEEDGLTDNGSQGGYFAEEQAVLPTCRNDKEFAFVSGLCGYQRVGLSR